MFYKRTFRDDALWSRCNESHQCSKLIFSHLSSLQPLKASISRFKDFFQGSCHSEFLYFLSDKKITVTGLLLVTFVLLLPFKSEAAISAITVNTIKGTQPYLIRLDEKDKTKEIKVEDVKELLRIKVPETSQGSSFIEIDPINADKTITVPAGVKFSQIEALVKADGTLSDMSQVAVVKVKDVDGDAENQVNTSVVGKMQATWYDGGVKITDLNQVINGCGGPYTLNVAIPNSIIAQTKYGDPRATDYGAIPNGVTYTFSSSVMNICYAKPRDLTVNTGTEGVDIKYASGYNPAKWVANKGFKASAGFPSTGFYKAEFSLLGPGNDQTKYQCISNDNGGKITLSGLSSKAVGKNCTITYNSATLKEFIAGGLPKIDMQYNPGDGTWTTFDSYQIPTPTKWPLIQGKGYWGTGSSWAALDKCRLAVDGSNTPATTSSQAQGLTSSNQEWRQKYMYRMDEFTNNPYATSLKPDEGSISTTSNGKGYFSRDVDSTFTGDWGNLYQYSGSGWDNYGFVWTAQWWTNGVNIAIVSILNGYVAYNSMIYTNDNTVCRGE